jgi:putative dimethyl sulfoxide reductase chaperone
MSAHLHTARPASAASVEARSNQMPLALLAQSREETYRLLSQSLLYPEEGRIGDVIQAAGDLWKERRELSRFTYFSQLVAVLGAFRDIERPAISELQASYVSMFATNTAGIPCPPYESAYLTPPGKASGWMLAQIERDYAALGFRFPSGAAELPDHIAIELEFMALLCGQEADAWEAQALSRARRALEEQRTFLDKHPRRWLPEFARQVKAFGRSELYARVTATAEAITCHDVRFVSALLTHVAGEEDQPKDKTKSQNSGGQRE